MPQNIYNVAKENIGNHITLDPSVPPDVGCAEAVSYILKTCNVPSFPSGGFSSTSDLNSWLQTHFLTVQSPLPGDIIISPTGAPGATLAHGHVGVIAIYGVLSNNSYTGLFDESLNLNWWYDYYSCRGGMPVIFYRATNN